MDQKYPHLGVLIGITFLAEQEATYMLSRSSTDPTYEGQLAI